MVCAFRALCLLVHVPAKGVSGTEMQSAVYLLSPALARGCICLGKGGHLSNQHTCAIWASGHLPAFIRLTFYQ